MCLGVNSSFVKHIYLISLFLYDCNDDDNVGDDDVPNKVPFAFFFTFFPIRCNGTSD